MLISQYKVLAEKVSSFTPAIIVGVFGLYLMGVIAPFNAWYMKVLPLLIGVLTFLTDKNNIHSILRAVENSVSITKAEWVYDSAMVDLFGRIIEKSVFNNYRRESAFF